VPVPVGAYFNVTPLDLGPVDVTLPAFVSPSGTAQTVSTKGVRVLAGQTSTFTVGFYSDAPTNGSWTLTATPGNPILAVRGADLLGQYNPSQITATVDKPSGQNGDTAHVTVAVTSTGTMFRGELLTLVSSLRGFSHYMPIWISGQ
jgi:hypothetical protein